MSAKYAIAFAANQEVMSFADTHTITDTRATSVFVMKGIPMQNVKQAVVSLTINLPNGETVQSMHTCKINIPGLPVALTGHIVPGLSIASLVGIHILCKAGCTVIFTDTTVEVLYNTKLILRGAKDPATDLWTLPITPTAILHAGTGKTSQMVWYTHGWAKTLRH
jgi:hypothetical protein